MNTKAARRYNAGLWVLEKLVFRALRKRLLRGASGSVLEIGIGTGVNLAFYDGPEFITGIDARTDLLHGVSDRSSSSPFAACCAKAGALPFPGNRFDFVVSTLVFCSVDDVPAALEEVKRVLKPGGKLVMMEHVRGLTPISRRITDWFHPAWFALQGECHLNRETEQSLRDAGFRIKHSGTHGRGIIQLLEAEPPVNRGNHKHQISNPK